MTEQTKQPDWIEGYENGVKRAWDLVGEAADWYRMQIENRKKVTDAPDDMSLRARYETALWLQQVIKRDSL